MDIHNLVKEKLRLKGITMNQNSVPIKTSSIKVQFFYLQFFWTFLSVYFLQIKNKATFGESVMIPVQSPINFADPQVFIFYISFKYIPTKAQNKYNNNNNIYTYII